MIVVIIVIIQTPLSSISPNLSPQVKELNSRVNTVMPREMEQETAKLTKLQEQLYEPQRSKEDVEHMRDEVSGTHAG
jgi:hypothetical protein